MKNKIDIVYCRYLRFMLKNKTFSIISNDCWGGGVYEDLDLPYTTPTVGLFFYAPCYIQFLEQFTELINCDLIFVSESKYEIANKYRNINTHFYPIGKLQEVEIHFLHYASEVEALEKWNRRKDRINFNNLFFKFSDRDLCSSDLIYRFDNLVATNKVFFSAKSLDTIKSAVYLKQYKGKPYIGDIYSDRWACRRDFDVVKWLNRGGVIR